MPTIDEGLNELEAHDRGLEDDRRVKYGQGEDSEAKQMTPSPEGAGEHKGVIRRFNDKLKDLLNRTR